MKKDFFFHPIRLFKALCFYLGLGAVLTGLTAGIGLYVFYSSLPRGPELEFSNLKKLAEKRILARRENKQLTHIWIPLSQISRDGIYSIVISEDSSFFEHSGIDYEAVLDSLAENLRKRKYEYGASTISQQVVKNLFLSQEKTLLRKAKELVITELLEKARSKNEILELYLNLAEFGRDLFGINEASQFYFKRPPLKVNAAQGAFMALMLPSPRKNQYAIFENKNLTPARKKRIRRILGDMMAEEFISPEQYRQYSNYDYFKR